MGDARRFAGGRVFTGRRFVEALAIEGGRVIAAGTDDVVRRSTPAGAEREDLAGGLVIPGLIDAHLHVAEIARERAGVDLGAVRSREELADRVLRWAHDHPAGWIIGRGWDAERFPDRRDPTRAELDAAVGDRPAVLYHISGHSAVANGAALRAAGYAEDASDPSGGKLGRAADGSLNGLVYERALDPLSAKTRESQPIAPDVLGRVLQTASAFGITTVGTMATDWEEWRGFEALRAAGTLPTRVRAYLRLPLMRADDRVRPVRPDARGELAMPGVKIFADGAFGPRTAWLDEPYADRPDLSGGPLLTPDELADAAAVVVARGFVPAIHAIGDRGLASVLAAFRRLSGSTPRPRIEHASLVPPARLPDLDAVRPALVVQPGFVWSDGWLAERLGPARAAHAYPFRTLIERGHLLAGSSDAPFDPVDPWRGLAAAVTRIGPDGKSANPSGSESVGAPTAVQMYTSNAGAALGADDLGHLEPGARADLVILDAPDLERAIARGAAGVRSTWRGGVPVPRGPADARPATV